MIEKQSKADLQKQLNELLPDMVKYKNMPMINHVPFAMNAGPFKYESTKLNTDKDGFRLTKYNGNYITLRDIEKFDKVNFLIGNSSAFGIGSSDDEHTITSLLSEKTGEPWFNISIRGAICLTEYIHAIRFLYKANKVNNIIIFSGINDIYLNLLLDKPTDFEKRIEPERWVYSCEKRIISRFFAKRYKLRQLDIINKSIKELLLYPFNKKDFIPKEKKLTKSEQINCCIDNLSKIFFLYAALEKQLNANVVYMLQPFYHWCTKKKSQQELQIFEILQELEKGTFWDRTRTELDHNVHETIVKRLTEEAKKCGINFVDTNSLYNTEQTVFSDSVHLTDFGNDFTTKIIQKYLK